MYIAKETDLNTEELNYEILFDLIPSHVHVFDYFFEQYDITPMFLRGMSYFDFNVEYTTQLAEYVVEKGYLETVVFNGDDR